MLAFKGFATVDKSTLEAMAKLGGFIIQVAVGCELMNGIACFSQLLRSVFWHQQN
jgi:hypothetical protein